jgi:hypothetical protein
MIISVPFGPETVLARTNLRPYLANRRPICQNILLEGFDLKKLSDGDLRTHFLAWQCRIRQISVRDYGGAPMPGMRPRVLTRSGDELVPAMTVLIVPKRPEESTAYFKFQLQRTHEHKQAYEAGVKYLSAGYFQDPALFSEEMTALFVAGSKTAERIVKARERLLDFEQYSQRFTIFCRTRKLKPGEAAHRATLWHNRIFNPDVANDAVVLGFTPDWKNVHADPMP